MSNQGRKNKKKRKRMRSRRRVKINVRAIDKNDKATIKKKYIEKLNPDGHDVKNEMPTIDLNKKFKFLTYNKHKKEMFDNVLGQDSLELLRKKMSEYFLTVLEKFKHNQDRYRTKEKISDEFLKLYYEKISSCEMIKYFMQELDIPQEGLLFFLQTHKDLYDEFLGLKRYKEYRFNGSYPVRLLWENGMYKIRCNGTGNELNCETVIIIDEWAIAYNHIDDISPWSNGTFTIFRYNKNTDELIDHQTIILDHFLLFEHYFADGVLFASDLARFIEYQFGDQDR